METKREDRIVIVLSNKGYVALENGQAFQLWKNKCLKDIYEELNYRYASYEISLGSLELIDFIKVDEVANEYLERCSSLEIESLCPSHRKKNEEQVKPDAVNNNKQRPGNRHNKMLYKSKIVAASGIRIIGSMMHFTFQTAADLALECEVKALSKLDVYELSFKELKQARMERTRLKQYKLKQIPESVLNVTIGLKESLRETINNVSHKMASEA